MHSPILSSRRQVAAAVIACAAAFAAVAVCAPASPAAGATPAASTTPACSTSGLVIWLDTQGNGTAGSIYYRLEFTNLSGRACTLRGYPGVSAVNLTGHKLGSAAARERSHKARTVTLANGTTATAVLRLVEAGAFSNSSCRQVTAAGLRIYLPNRTTAKVVPFPLSACSRAGPVYLMVRSVQKA